MIGSDLNNRVSGRMGAVTRRGREKLEAQQSDPEEKLLRDIDDRIAGVPEDSPDLVSSYLEAVADWQSPATVDNAFKLEEARKKRLAAVAEMSKEGSLHLLTHPSLTRARAYLQADMAELSGEDRKKHSYSETLRDREVIREALFPDGGELTADAYAKAVKTSQSMIAGRLNVDLERKTLDVRREVAQEHFGDAKFIAACARAKGNHLEDEMFVDFGMSNPREDELSERRAKAAAEIFTDKAGKSFEEDGQLGMIDHFQSLTGMRKEMLTNPLAVAEFSRMTMPREGTRSEDVRAYSVGLSALEKRNSGASTISEFHKSLSEEERGQLGAMGPEGIPAMFAVARKKFVEDYKAGRPSVGTNFAIMEMAAARLHAIGAPAVEAVGFIGSKEEAQENLQALAALNPKQEVGPLQKRRASDAKFKEEIRTKMGERLRKKRDDKTEREEDIVGGEDGRDIGFRIGSEVVPKITVKGGSEVEISYMNKGFEKSKEVDGLKKGLGVDLENVSVMREFLSGGADEVRKPEEDGRKFRDEFLKAIGEKGDPSFKEAFRNGKETKEQRAALALKLGLGKTVLDGLSLGEDAHAKLAAAGEGEKDSLIRDMQKRADQAGLGGEAVKRAIGNDPLSRLGLGTTDLKAASQAKSEDEARSLWGDVEQRRANFRLEGIVAPAAGVKTTKGGLDAGAEGKGYLEDLLSKCSGSGYSGLDFEFKKGKEGNVVAIKLDDGRNASDVMLRDGFALPDNDKEDIRREKITQMAQDGKAGLWKMGFPEDDGTWRSDLRSAAMTNEEKSDKLCESVAASMPGSARRIEPYLSDRNAKIFALPVRAWSANGNVKSAVDRATKANPGKMLKIYENNMELLNDLRERHKKGNLSNDEKLAHDRLSVGRRILGPSLVAAGVLDKEQEKADGHRLISDGGLALVKKMSEKTATGFGKGLDFTGSAVSTGARLAEKSFNIAASLLD